MSVENPTHLNDVETEFDPLKEEFAITHIEGLTSDDLRTLPREGLREVGVGVTTEDGRKFSLVHFPRHEPEVDLVRSCIYIFTSHENLGKVKALKGRVMRVAGGRSLDDGGRIILGKRNRLTPTRIADLVEKYSELFPKVEIEEASYVGPRMTRESLGLPKRVEVESV